MERKEIEIEITECTQEQLQPWETANPKLCIKKASRNGEIYEENYSFGVDYSSKKDFCSYLNIKKEPTSNEKITKGYLDQLHEDIHKFEFLTSKRPNIIFLGIEAFLFIKGNTRDLYLNNKQEYLFQGINIKIDYVDKYKLDVGYLLSYN